VTENLQRDKLRKHTTAEVATRRSAAVLHALRGVVSLHYSAAGIVRNGLWIRDSAARHSLVEGHGVVYWIACRWLWAGVTESTTALGHRSDRAAGKFLGAIGMTVAVFRGQVSANVLWLLPLNDVIWWWPFWLIVRDNWRATINTQQVE
jgi:hypothetical protein